MKRRVAHTPAIRSEAPSSRASRVLHTADEHWTRVSDMGARLCYSESALSSSGGDFGFRAEAAERRELR
jgi:hypothetical protein